MEIVVAIDQNWAIGNGGDQLVYFSADLKHFKALTTGHSVILGRKTLTTFPGGKPLKGRRNLILSRNPAFTAEGAEVFHSLEALRAAAGEDAVVIGGSSVYRMLLPWCGVAHVTKIDAAFQADAFFPNLDEDPEWALVSEEPPIEEKGYTFRFTTYQRRGTACM